MAILGCDLWPVCKLRWWIYVIWIEFWASIGVVVAKIMATLTRQQLGGQDGQEKWKESQVLRLVPWVKVQHQRLLWLEQSVPPIKALYLCSFRGTAGPAQNFFYPSSINYDRHRPSLSVSQWHVNESFPLYRGNTNLLLPLLIDHFGGISISLAIAALSAMIRCRWSELCLWPRLHSGKERARAIERGRRRMRLNYF